MIIYPHTKYPLGLADSLSMLYNDLVYLCLVEFRAKCYIDCSSFYSALSFSKVFWLLLTYFLKLLISCAGLHYYFKQIALSDDLSWLNLKDLSISDIAQYFEMFVKNSFIYQRFLYFFMRGIVFLIVIAKIGNYCHEIKYLIFWTFPSTLYIFVLICLLFRNYTDFCCLICHLGTHQSNKTKLFSI